MIGVGLFVLVAGFGAWLLSSTTPRPTFTAKIKKTVPKTGDARLMGDITNLQVARPNYNNPRRTGTKLTFDLNICNLGSGATMIRSAKVTVVFAKHDPEWRPGYALEDKIGYVQETRDIFKGFDLEQVFELGKWVAFPCVVYFDDFSDDTCVSENLKVHLTDTRNLVHTFSLRS